jgi:hypothetical protein
LTAFERGMSSTKTNRRGILKLASRSRQ